MGEKKDYESDKTCEATGLSNGLVGKPTDEHFIIEQANITLKTLVEYEAQYTTGTPEKIQKRILELADFIKKQLDGFAD